MFSALGIVYYKLYYGLYNIFVKYTFLLYVIFEHYELQISHLSRIFLSIYTFTQTEILDIRRYKHNLGPCTPVCCFQQQKNEFVCLYFVCERVRWKSHEYWYKPSSATFCYLMCFVSGDSSIGYRLQIAGKTVHTPFRIGQFHPYDLLKAGKVPFETTHPNNYVDTFLCFQMASRN